MKFSFLTFFVILIIQFHLILNYEKEISINLIENISNKNQKILISGYYHQSKIYVKCRSNIGIIKKFKPTLKFSKQGITFNINFSKYPICKIINIQKLDINEGNYNIILNYEKISVFQKNTYFTENLIKSKIKLKQYYLKISDLHFKLNYIKKSKGNYIYLINNNHKDEDIFLCKKNICFKIHKKKRKSTNENFPKLLKIDKISHKIIDHNFNFTIKFTFNINIDNLLINFNSENNNFYITEEELKKDEGENNIYIYNNKKKRKEGLYYISLIYEDNSIFETGITFLLYYNEIIITSKKTVSLINANSFKFIVNLKKEIFKQQIKEIKYIKEEENIENTLEESNYILMNKELQFDIHSINNNDRPISYIFIIYNNVNKKQYFKLKITNSIILDSQNIKISNLYNNKNDNSVKIRLSKIKVIKSDTFSLENKKLLRNLNGAYEEEQWEEEEEVKEEQREEEYEEEEEEDEEEHEEQVEEVVEKEEEVEVEKEHEEVEEELEENEEELEVEEEIEEEEEEEEEEIEVEIEETVNDEAEEDEEEEFEEEEVEEDFEEEDEVEEEVEKEQEEEEEEEEFDEEEVQEEQEEEEEEEEEEEIEVLEEEIEVEEEVEEVEELEKEEKEEVEEKEEEIEEEVEENEEEEDKEEEIEVEEEVEEGVEEMK